MNTRIFIFFVGVLFVSCKTSNSCDAYFSSVPVDEIIEISSQDIKYERMAVDHHLPELGYYDVPLIDFKFKYDTISHYDLIVNGYAILKDINQTDNSQRVVSVAISWIAVKRNHHGLEYYSINPEIGSTYGNRKPWKECPLPKSVRDKIKEDFLIRMKHIKYHLKTGTDIFYLTWPYRLW